MRGGRAESGRVRWYGADDTSWIDMGETVYIGADDTRRYGRNGASVYRCRWH